MAAVGSLLFLFGGSQGSKVDVRNEVDEYKGPPTLPSALPPDLWKYSTATATWELLVTPAGPSARYDHAMAAAGADILIHGGYVGTTASGELRVLGSDKACVLLD